MAEKKKPAIRFRGFMGEWEECKAKDICSISTGKSNTQDKIDNGIYPFYVRSPVIERSNRYLYDEEAVLTVGDGVGTGKVFHYVNGKYDLHQRVYRMFNFNNHVSTKYFYYYFSNHFYNRVMSMTAKTSVDSVRYEMISEMHIKYPNEVEQQAITKIFENFDHLIFLYQHKYDKLQNFKKSMLEKMFPQNGSSVPEIRFRGFTEEWEERRFSEIFILLQNNSLSRADLNNEQGCVKNIHYGDVLIKFGEVLDAKKEEIPFVSNDEFIINRESLLQNGDIIIADAAEDETVGKCSEIKGIKDISVISGLHTIPCRPTKTFATGYLGYYINSNAYHNQLLPLIQGTKISSISKSVLLNTHIIYTNFDEQTKIGSFFTHLDHLITLHKHKLEKLQNIKKACLEKMFV